MEREVGENDSEGGKEPIQGCGTAGMQPNNHRMYCTLWCICWSCIVYGIDGFKMALLSSLAFSPS